MIGFWDSKLSGAPPLLNWVIRRLGLSIVCCLAAYREQILMDGPVMDNVAFAGTAAAIIFLLCSGVYLVICLFRWIKNAEWPRERVIFAIRVSLGFSLLHGISLICGGCFVFLTREVLYDDLPITDRRHFVQLGWTCLLGGLAFAIPAALGRRYIRPTACTEQGGLLNVPQ